MASHVAFGGGNPDLTAAHVAPGSFRDPQGQVFELGERIYRAIYSPIAPFPHTWSDTGPLAEFVADGRLLAARPLALDAAPAELLQAAPRATGFLEQPRLTPITYPYEW